MVLLFGLSGTLEETFLIMIRKGEIKSYKIDLPEILNF